MDRKLVYSLQKLPDDRTIQVSEGSLSLIIEFLGSDWLERDAQTVYTGTPLD